MSDMAASLNAANFGLVNQNQEVLEVSSDEDVPKSRTRVSQRELLEAVRNTRGLPIQIQCVRCNKWRQTDHDDPATVPENWECSMNIGMQKDSCDMEEDSVPSRVIFAYINNIYTAGSVVWAKVDGFPWWPGIVDDCPDNAQFFWLTNSPTTPSHYHVVFFDEAGTSRSWVSTRKIKPFKKHPDLDTSMSKSEILMYGSRISWGKNMAEEALKYRTWKRLNKFGFLALWTGEIKTPPRPDDDSDSTQIENDKQKKVVKRRLFDEKKLKINPKTSDLNDSSDESSDETNKRKVLKNRRKKRNSSPEWKPKSIEAVTYRTYPKRKRTNKSEKEVESVDLYTEISLNVTQMETRGSQTAQPPQEDKVEDINFLWGMSLDSDTSTNVEEPLKSESGDDTLGSLTFNLEDDDDVDIQWYSPPN